MVIPIMSRPAAFLDRDGVLIHDVGYPHRPDQLQMMDGAAAAVKRLNDVGFVTVIVTNQSGIARGYFDEDTMHAFHELLLVELAKGGAKIDAIYFCPYHSVAADPKYQHPDHPDRKPNPGMLLRAASDLGLRLDESSIMIGDNTSDIEAAENAGVKGFLFKGGNLDTFVSTIVGD